MKKRIILLLLPLMVAATSVYAEPLFGTSGYEEEVESTDYETQQPVTITTLKRQIDRQKERIDGLTTLVEGLSSQLFEMQQQKSTMPSAESGDNTQLIQRLAAMIDKINGDYVSKAELQQILARSGGYQATTASKPQPSATTQPSSSAVEEKPNATLYSEGVRAFGKREYDEAKKRFTITDQKGYKPAASNYYLGEIAYYTKQYEDAIFYFKKSAGLYDKAEYIDVLLLHTAISLEMTGQKDQARVFYQNIIDNYHGRKSAQIAKEKIGRL